MKVSLSENSGGCDSAAGLNSPIPLGRKGEGRGF